LPPFLFLDLLFSGLQGKLADALGELSTMAAKRCIILMVSFPFFHNLDLLFCQPAKLVDGVDLIV
jgi:hypothetical protein